MVPKPLSNLSQNFLNLQCATQINSDFFKQKVFHIISLTVVFCPVVRTALDRFVKFCSQIMDPGRALKKSNLIETRDQGDSLQTKGNKLQMQWNGLCWLHTMLILVILSWSLTSRWSEQTIFTIDEIITFCSQFWCFGQNVKGRYTGCCSSHIKKITTSLCSEDQASSDKHDHLKFENCWERKPTFRVCRRLWLSIWTSTVTGSSRPLERVA